MRSSEVNLKKKERELAHGKHEEDLLANRVVNAGELSVDVGMLVKQEDTAESAKMMNFVFKTRNFVFKMTQKRGSFHLK